MSIQLYSSPMKYKDPTTGNYVDIIGISGNPGRGIASVVLNNDYTLTINFTDNTSITTGAIRGATGVGISSIAKTGTSANVDTYTITYTDNNTTTFSITNGITPSLSIGTVVEGAEAAATITGTSENPVLNLVLPAAAVSGKADKVSGATSGNFAALDANGNLTDSGHKHSDYLTEHQTIPVTDVQLDGSSIVSNGVATIPKAEMIGATGTYGVVKIGSGMGLAFDSTILPGALRVNPASENVIKLASSAYRPIAPSLQHYSTFYGLAAAAGDSTQSASDNEVGTYTSAAKEKIQAMLDVPSQNVIAASDTTTATSAHVIGDYFMLNGQLCKATAAIAIGDTITTSGGSANAEVVKVSDEIKAVEGEIPDIQINGTSIVANETANIPVAGTNTLGVIKVGSGTGLGLDDDNKLALVVARASDIKTGTNTYKPIVPASIHSTTFYGLAKAAGDSTQSASDNAVGTYTSGAKTAIQTMLDVPSKGDLGSLVLVQDATPSDTTSRIWFPATAPASVQVPTVSEMNTALAGKVDDVQINGTSIVSNGVANIPQASTSTVGVIKVGNGLFISSDAIHINTAPDNLVKKGSNTYAPITPSNQEKATFYGLAKAAGADMKDSSNAVGTYTDTAKGKIQSMLGITNLISTDESSLVASKAYAIGDVFCANGKMYKATAAIASGATIVVEGNGANASEIKIEGTFVKNTDYATQSVGGVVKVYPTVGSYGGISISNDTLVLAETTDANIKAGTSKNRAVMPHQQHIATFYGLAKAAGDSTQSASDNAVGTYTDTAKSAIRSMIGAIGDTDYATDSTGGVVKINSSYGLLIAPNGTVIPQMATAAVIQDGSAAYYLLSASLQHQSVFYGLSKVAGVDLANETVTLGTYPSASKTAIQTMIGVESGVTFVETVTGTTPVITGIPNTKYICGEVSTLTITTPSAGAIDIIFSSGSTATILTVTPPTGTTMKWPTWFDPTVLLPNTTYEILITEGIYGSVMTWAS